MPKKRWIQEGKCLMNGSRTIQIGDYVRYKALGTSYKGKWIAIGVSDDGYLMIMPERSLSQVPLSGKTGYTDGVRILNETCSKYATGKGAILGRSATIEDINKFASAFVRGTKQPDTEGYEYFWEGTLFPRCKKNEETTKLMSEHKKFVWHDEEAKEWKSSKNDFKSEKITTITSNCYVYDFYTNKKGYDDAFWLASNCVDATNSSVVCYGMQLMRTYSNSSRNLVTYSYLVESDGTEYHEIRGVCPVVYLDSDLEFYPIEWGF